MSGKCSASYSSEWHDPVDCLETVTDPLSGDVYHKGAYYEEWRQHDTTQKKWKAALARWNELSKDPVRRSSQIRWLRQGVDPFDARSMLAYARRGKDEAGRWLAMSDLASYGLLDRSCVPTLAHAARTEPSQQNRMLALHLMSQVIRERGERDYIHALNSRSFRFKITPLSCIFNYGSSRSVPHVCAFLRKAVKRRRAGMDRDSDIAFAAKFLDKHLDSMPMVEDAFKEVIRFWGNLSYPEAMCVLQWVRYIGIRTLEPIDPESDQDSDRVTINTPAFRRRLWKNKEGPRKLYNQRVSSVSRPAKS